MRIKMDMRRSKMETITPMRYTIRIKVNVTGNVPEGK
jgi:hypothetical protein